MRCSWREPLFDLFEGDDPLLLRSLREKSHELRAAGEFGDLTIEGVRGLDHELAPVPATYQDRLAGRGFEQLVDGDCCFFKSTPISEAPKIINHSAAASLGIPGRSADLIAGWLIIFPASGHSSGFLDATPTRLLPGRHAAIRPGFHGPPARTGRPRPFATPIFRGTLEGCYGRENNHPREATSGIAAPPAGTSSSPRRRLSGTTRPSAPSSWPVSRSAASPSGSATRSRRSNRWPVASARLAAAAWRPPFSTRRPRASPRDGRR